MWFYLAKLITCCIVVFVQKRFTFYFCREGRGVFFCLEKCLPLVFFSRSFASSAVADSKMRKAAGFFVYRPQPCEGTKGSGEWFNWSLTNRWSKGLIREDNIEIKKKCKTNDLIHFSAALEPCLLEERWPIRKLSKSSGWRSFLKQTKNVKAMNFVTKRRQINVF